MARSDLVRSAYRYLMDSGVPAQLIADDLLGVDDVYPTGWVFRSEVDGLPFVDIEGTGLGAITIYSYDDWSASSSNHSSVFPRLNIAIFSDPDRDNNPFPTKRNGADKVRRIHELIHPLFHDSGNRVHKFDDLIVISTVAGSGLSIGPTLNGDGMMRGIQSYDLVIL